MFGPHDRYPPASRTCYEPPLALLDDYLALAARLGFERFVFVQPSAYGTDNSCMLDAMERVGQAARGIVDIAEDLPEDEIADLHARGVRGVRINTSPVAPYDESRGAALMPRIEALAGRLRGRGWCLEFLGPGWLTRALMPVMRGIGIDCIVDHMGMFLAAEGVDQPGFRELLDLMHDGRCRVELTAVYRMSKAPGFADAAPLVRALAEAAPDRLLWGTDHRHLSFADKVASVALFNLLGAWFPDPAMRHKVLVENPARLFGYA